MPNAGNSPRLRALAGLWFAGFALLGSAAMYVSAVVDRDALTAVLYLGYPTLSAFLAAMLLGPRVVGASSRLRAALSGAGIVLVAFAFFAPLYVVTLDLGGRVQSRPALLGAVLTLGLVMTGPVLLPLGAAAGYLFYIILRRAGGERLQFLKR